MLDLTLRLDGEEAAAVEEMARNIDHFEAVHYHHISIVSIRVF